MTSNPCFTASAMPRSVAVSPAASPSKASQSRLVSRPSSLQLLFGERGAHARDDRLEPGLAQRDDVGVAFDDAGTILAGDRRARLVEPVDHPPLVEELRLGRVDVLRLQRVVVEQLARLEPEHAALPIGQAERAGDGRSSRPTLPHQSRGPELVGREALRDRLAGERLAAERVPETKFAAHLLAEAATLEVVAHERCRLPSPRASARRTRQPARAASEAARGRAGQPPRPASSPRTRPGRGIVRRATRSSRRSRAPRSPERT